MGKHRKTTRYKIGLAAVLHPAGEKVGANVMVRAISTQGCELDHVEAPKIGKFCELYFDWRGTHIGLEAEVAWKDAGGRVGLKFLRVDKDSQKRLEELCAELHAQRPPAPQQKEADSGQSLLDPQKGQREARASIPPEPKPSQPLPSMTEGNRRLVPRYVSELSASLTNLSTGATIGVKLVIISVLGARLEGSPLLDVGQHCELRTEWEGKELVLRGTVVWKTKELAGIKFSSVDEETAKLLRQLCANLRLQPRG